MPARARYEDVHLCLHSRQDGRYYLVHVLSTLRHGHGSTSESPV